MRNRHQSVIKENAVLCHDGSRTSLALIFLLPYGALVSHDWHQQLHLDHLRGTGKPGHLSLPREIPASYLLTPVLSVFGNSTAGVDFLFSGG